VDNNTQHLTTSPKRREIGQRTCYLEARVDGSVRSRAIVRASQIGEAVGQCVSGLQILMEQSQVADPPVERPRVSLVVTLR
jgi:hypothetical protein